MSEPKEVNVNLGGTPLRVQQITDTHYKVWSGDTWIGDYLPGNDGKVFPGPQPIAGERLNPTDLHPLNLLVVAELNKPAT